MLFLLMFSCCFISDSVGVSVAGVLLMLSFLLWCVVRVVVFLVFWGFFF